MNHDQLIQFYYLVRSLYWNNQVGQLTDEAQAALIQALNEAQGGIQKAIAKKIERWGRALQWTQELEQEVVASISEALAGSASAVAEFITATAVGTATATLAEYNALLSFDGKASGVKLAEGLTAAQIKQFFEEQPLGGKLLKEWVQDAFDSGAQASILAAIREGVVAGEGYEALVERVMTATDIGFIRSRRDVAMLVKTYVQSANVGAQDVVFKENEDVIKGYVRREALDNRTCRTCFTGETFVEPLGALQGVSKGLYTGEMVIITTATGKQLEGTPNHPILTPAGWLPLDKIKPNQQIINATVLKSSRTLGVENICMPSMFCELFDSLGSSSLSEIRTESTSPDDFQGDGVGFDKKIDIVTPNLFLGNQFCDAVCNQRGVDEKLCLGHNAASLFPDGSFNHLFVSSFAPLLSPQKATILAHNRIKPFFAPVQLFHDFFRRNSIVKHDKSLISGDFAITASVIPGDVFHKFTLNEKLCNCSSGYTVDFSNLTSRFPIDITIDNVVSVERKFRTVHVYNLHTCQGLYIANGIIVKNCALNDGMFYKTNEQRPSLPAHPSCRGIWIPKTVSYKELGIELEELDEVLRSWNIREDGTIDTGGKKILSYGKISGDFGAWYDSLSDKDKMKTSIGPIRGKLLKSGAVTWRQLVDKKTGRPFLLDELGFDNYGNKLDG